MLRIARPEDFDLIKGMILKFAENSPIADQVSEDKLSALIENFISNGQDKIILLHGEAGLIAGMVTPFIYGNGLVATELVWWVEPDKRKSSVGKELLKAFEFWANKIGCKFVVMSSLDEEVGKFYEKNNYVLRERSYIKGL
jgi:GNAT superfamily N-acetyltransferase